MLNHPLKHSKFPFSLGVHDTSLLGGQILFSCFCCNFPPTNFIGLMFSLYLNNDDFPGVIVRPGCQRSQPILISSSPIRMIHQQSTTNNNNQIDPTTINKQQQQSTSNNNNQQATTTINKQQQQSTNNNNNQQATTTIGLIHQQHTMHVEKFFS